MYESRHTKKKNFPIFSISILPTRHREFSLFPSNPRNILNFLFPSYPRDILNFLCFFLTLATFWIFSVSILPTHLGFLQMIGHTSIPDGLEGLQKKSAYCWQFFASVQLAWGGARIKETIQWKDRAAGIVWNITIKVINTLYNQLVNRVKFKRLHANELI